MSLRFQKKLHKNFLKELPENASNYSRTFVKKMSKEFLKQNILKQKQFWCISKDIAWGISWGVSKRILEFMRNSWKVIFFLKFLKEFPKKSHWKKVGKFIKKIGIIPINISGLFLRKFSVILLKNLHEFLECFCMNFYGYFRGILGRIREKSSVTWRNWSAHLAYWES